MCSSCIHMHTIHVCVRVCIHIYTHNMGTHTLFLSPSPSLSHTCIHTHTHNICTHSLFVSLSLPLVVIVLSSSKASHPASTRAPALAHIYAYQCVCVCVCVLYVDACVNVMSLAAPRPISPHSYLPLPPPSLPPLLSFPCALGCRGVGFRERARS